MDTRDTILTPQQVEGGEMNREIKFRQPNFSKGAFIGWHYWGFIGGGRFDGIQTGTTSITEAQKISQQYTGLKDKNGKEIYEGDILITPLGNGEIIYATSYCSFRIKGKTFGSVLAERDEEDGVAENYLGVIGNIYDNPELLEASDVHE